MMILLNTIFKNKGLESMAIRLFLILILTGVHKTVLSQDPQFSQFYSAKFNIAPSFAGSTDGGKLNVVLRDQWPFVKNTYVTYGFAVDHSFPILNGGIGLYVMQDFSNGGGYTVTNIGVQYSYRIKLNHRWQLKPGLQLDYLNKKLDLSRIILGDQLTFDEYGPMQSNSLVNDNVSEYKTSVSLLLHSGHIWFGCTMDNIPLTNKSVSGEYSSSEAKFMSFGGARLKTIRGRLLYDEEYIYFSYLFKMQDKFKQMDLGVSWSKKKIELGLWYRGLPFLKNDYGSYYYTALIAKLGLSYQNFSVGYSFDYSLNRMIPYTGGAHEISMVSLFNQAPTKKKRKYKMIPCPKI